MNSSETAAESEFQLGGFLAARFCSFMIALGFLGSVVTLASLAARWDWRLDLLVNMRTQLLLGAAIVVASMVLLRKWKFAVLFGVFFCINLADVLPLFLPQHSVGTDSVSSIKLLAGNVLTDNEKKQEYVEQLRAENADVLVLLEVDELWADALKKLTDVYPHSAVYPRGDNFGIAMFSRFPLGDTRSEFFSSDLPTIVTEVRTSATASVLVIGTHPVPPKGSDHFAHRNTQLQEIATLAAKSEMPTVVCGDFNATPWSPVFKSMLRDGKLKDARRGFGLKSTWPESRWPLNIPIDHVLVSPGVTVSDFSVGPHVGSDHRMVIAELQIPNDGR